MYRKRHIYIVHIQRLVLRAHYYDSLISVIIRSKFKILLICAHFYMCTYFNVSPLINSRAEVELYTCLLKRRDFDGNDYMSSLLYFQICVFVTYHYILYHSFSTICTCTYMISLDFAESHETNSNVYLNLNIKQSCILSKQIVPVESPSTLKIDRNNFLLEATNYNIS